jgi:hypothetical protein
MYSGAKSTDLHDLGVLPCHLGFNSGEGKVEHSCLCLASRILQLEIHIEHRLGLRRQVVRFGFSLVMLGPQIVQFAVSEERFSKVTGVPLEGRDVPLETLHQIPELENRAFSIGYQDFQVRFAIFLLSQVGRKGLYREVSARS